MISGLAQNCGCKELEIVVKMQTSKMTFQQPNVRRTLPLQGVRTEGCQCMTSPSRLILCLYVYLANANNMT
jgi:hypothetical protein